MGTVIYDKNGIHIKRFYGGLRRGVCYQISIGQCYIQLLESEFIEFLLELGVYGVKRLFT